MSENGKLFYDIIKRQNLVVGNALSSCKGTFTRHRSTIVREEKSVIDYIVFCEKLNQYFETMFIDDERTHVLTKYVQPKGTRK